MPPPLSARYAPAMQEEQSTNSSCACEDVVETVVTPAAPPASERYFPDGHTLQLTDPDPSWKVPAKQLVQLAEPVDA